MKLQLDEEGRERLLQIRKEITDNVNRKNRSCPSWGVFMEIPEHLIESDQTDGGCEICHAIFPKVPTRIPIHEQGEKDFAVSSKCPCDMYSKKHLLKKIDDILKGNVEI